MDYIIYWKRFSTFYLFLSICICIIFASIYMPFLSWFNLFLFMGIIIISVFFYKFQNPFPDATEHMSRYNMRYLLVKLIEIFLQQLVIILLFVATNKNIVLFSSIFVLLHLHLFFYKKLISSIMIMTFAFLLSLLFYTIYAYEGAYGIIIAYGIHVAVYLVGGKVFQHIYEPDTKS